MRIVSSRQSDDLVRPRDTMLARIRPLSVLPVFFDLKGKRAVVIGGSEAAVWKAELLSSAGAETAIFAATPEKDMLALVARACKAGALWVERPLFPRGISTGSGWGQGDSVFAFHPEHG